VGEDVSGAPRAWAGCVGGGSALRMACSCAVRARELVNEMCRVFAGIQLWMAYLI
jgi:hypothetical protein